MSAATTKPSPERLETVRRLNLVRRPEQVPKRISDPAEQYPTCRRAQVERLVKGVLRHRNLLDALLMATESFDARKTPGIIMWILRLAAYEKIFQSQAHDYAVGHQAVALARDFKGESAARFVNAVVRRLVTVLPEDERALAGHPLVKDLPAADRWSVPDPLLRVLSEGYGRQVLEGILPTINQEAPIWIRVNRLQLSPEQLLARLQQEGLVVEASSLLSEALRFHSGPFPWKTRAWEQGHMTVQDLGSMLATEILDPVPGEHVLDVCAAPGGKTGHIWERIQGRGRLVALETSERRRHMLAKALQRLYGIGHSIRLPEVRRLEEFPPARMFDAVLVDAPCLALGLLRRHPEVRWDGRLRGQAFIQQTQTRILAQAARHVRPGGRLLWVTCSPTRIENEEVVEPFLQHQAGRWRRIDLAQRLPSAWHPQVQLQKGYLRTRPDRLPVDGFAMVLLERGAS